MGLRTASARVFRYKLRTTRFVVAGGSSNGPCPHLRVVGTLETLVAL